MQFFTRDVGGAFILFLSLWAISFVVRGDTSEVIVYNFLIVPFEWCGILTCLKNTIKK